MSLSLGAWKLGTWAIGVTAAAVYTFFEKDTTSIRQLIIIGCTIAAVPPTITGVFGLILQARANRKLNGILAKAHAGEQAATTRADKAEAFTAGSDSEREKGKP